MRAASRRLPRRRRFWGAGSLRRGGPMDKPPRGALPGKPGEGPEPSYGPPGTPQRPRPLPTWTDLCRTRYDQRLADALTRRPQTPADRAYAPLARRQAQTRTKRLHTLLLHP